MRLTVEIPDEAIYSLGHCAGDAASALKLELALALYRRGAVSVGAAAQVAGLKRFEFEASLAEQSIERNYSTADLAGDIMWANSLKRID